MWQLAPVSPISETHILNIITQQTTEKTAEKETLCVLKHPCVPKGTSLIWYNTMVLSHRHGSCPILSLHHFLHHLEVFFKIACNNVRFKPTFVERQYRKAFSLYRDMSNYLISADLNITSRQEKVVTIILRIFKRMHLKHANSMSFGALNLKF